MICPTCPPNFQHLALFQCDDGKHRCWSCKTAKPTATAQPATAPTQTEHAAILTAKVAIRNRLARMESLSDWDKSPWNCGKHEGLSEALGILKGEGK